MVVWTLPYIVSFFLWFINDIVDDQCYLWYNVETTTQRIMILVYGMLMFAFIPSIILIYLYTRMALAINFNFSSKANETANKRSSRNQMNIFSTCLLMVVVFLISWTYYMGAVIQASVKKGSMASLLSDVFFLSEVLLEVNSCINPIIYAARFVLLVEILY